MSSRDSLRRSLGVLLSVAALAASGSARAEPTAEAREANKRALELFKDGKYRDALADFQKAYDASPSWIILCNIGKTSRLTQDFARSLTAYQKCLDDGGVDVDGAQRTEVEREIVELDALVGWVTVEGAPGAVVRIDDRVIGTLPLAHKLAVNPGARSFSCTKESRRREEAVTVKATDSVDVDLAFVDPPAPPRAPKAADPHGFRFPDGLIVSAWFVSSAFAVTAISTGTAALVTSANLKETLYVGPARAPLPGSPIDSQAGRVRALGAATDAFIALAAVTGAAAISFTIVNAAMATPKDEKSAASSVRVSAGLRGLSLTGAF